MFFWGRKRQADDSKPDDAHVDDTDVRAVDDADVRAVDEDDTRDSDEDDFDWNKLVGAHFARPAHLSAEAPASAGEETDEDDARLTGDDVQASGDEVWSSEDATKSTEDDASISEDATEPTEDDASISEDATEPTEDDASISEDATVQYDEPVGGEEPGESAGDDEPTPLGPDDEPSESDAIDDANGGADKSGEVGVPDSQNVDDSPDANPDDGPSDDAGDDSVDDGESDGEDPGSEETGEEPEVTAEVAGKPEVADDAAQDHRAVDGDAGEDETTADAASESEKVAENADETLTDAEEEAEAVSGEMPVATEEEVETAGETPNDTEEKDESASDTPIATDEKVESVDDTLSDAGEETDITDETPVDMEEEAESEGDAPTTTDEEVEIADDMPTGDGEEADTTGEISVETDEDSDATDRLSVESVDGDEEPDADQAEGVTSTDANDTAEPTDGTPADTNESAEPTDETKADTDEAPAEPADDSSDATDNHDGETLARGQLIEIVVPVVPERLPSYDEEHGRAIGESYQEDFSRFERLPKSSSGRKLPAAHLPKADGAVNQVPGEGKSRSKVRPVLAFLLVSIMVAGIAAAGTYGFELWGGTSLPNVVGLSESQAKAELEAKGFSSVEATTRIADDGIGHVMEQSPAAGARVETDTQVTIVIASNREMPDVEGLDREQAQKLLREAGAVSFKIEEKASSEEEGTVLSTRPAPGAGFTAHQTVTLVVAMKAIVPDVMGKGRLEAVATIENAGFVVETSLVRSTALQNTVVDQEPEPGSKLEPGETVSLVFANPNLVEVLQLMDYFSEDPKEIAKSLTKQGFTLSSGHVADEGYGESAYTSTTQGRLLFVDRPFSHAYSVSTKEDVLAKGLKFRGIRWEVPSSMLPSDASKLTKSAANKLMGTCGFDGSKESCTQDDIVVPEGTRKSGAKFLCTYGETKGYAWTVLIVVDGSTTRAVVTCAPRSLYEEKYDLKPYGGSICDMIAYSDVYTE